MGFYSFEQILDKSPKEIEILNEIENLQDVYEHSEGYLCFKQKIDDLYDALADERKSKATEIIQGVPRKRMVGNKQNIKHLDGDKGKKSPSAEYLNCMEVFNNLSQKEKIKFLRNIYSNNLDHIEDYHQPKTSQENIYELQSLLMAICVDYLAVKGLDEVDIDGLKESILASEWVPSTDCFLTVYGRVADEDGLEKTKKNWGGFLKSENHQLQLPNSS